MSTATELKKPFVVGFVGFRNSGKTTLAEQLHLVMREDTALYSMADPVCEVLSTAMEHFGNWSVPAEAMKFQHIKRAPLQEGSELYGDVRSALNTLGDTMKDLFGFGAVCNAANNAVTRMGAYAEIVFIHNVRYPEEAELCDVIVHVDCPEVTATLPEALHASETSFHDIHVDLNYTTDKTLSEGDTIANVVELANNIRQWRSENSLA